MEVTLAATVKRCPAVIELDMVGMIRTADDVAWQALHECDLYEEGEDTELNKSEYRKVKRFLAWCRKKGFKS